MECNLAVYVGITLILLKICISTSRYHNFKRQWWNADWVTWNKFVKQGQSQNIIANLPPFVLLAISMKTAWELMYQQLMLNQPYAQEMLEEVIIRTWKAITI